jgi:hypothetical protein
VEALRIVALATVAAVVYGILQDQVTARICVEYFTIGHPKVVESTSPTVLALVWGVLATWWVGLPLGALLAVAARAGSRPPLSWRDLVRPMVVLLLAIGFCAAAAGAVGHAQASAGNVTLVGDLARAVPRTRHVDFLTDLWAHSAAYAAGGVGGVILAAWAWRRRGRGAPPPVADREPIS